MEFKDLEQIRAYFSADEFATKCLGAHVDSYDFETGEARVSMTIDDRHHNAQGFVMGGVFFALGDFALAVCCNVNQEPTASVAMTIEHMRRAKGDHLHACAHPDKVGRALSFVTIDLYDGEQRHVARMVATVMRTSH